VRYECCDFTLVFVYGASDLQGGDDQSARRVQHDIKWDSRVCEVNGSQQFFRVVDVYIPKHRKPENAHRLLPVNQQDDARSSLAFDLLYEPLA
jgi:hypothetical protein